LRGVIGLLSPQNYLRRGQKEEKITKAVLQNPRAV
jgi:hypothetical protein